MSSPDVVIAGAGPAGGAVLLVGDAAGYYDPLTGQGISRAIRGAQIAATSILRELADPSSQGEFHGYSRSRRRPDPGYG